MGKMQFLRDQLVAGATVKELIDQGHSRSSIYAANRSLNNKATTGSRKGGSIGGESNRSKGPNKPFRESLPVEVAADPEILTLQHELAKTKLKNEIADAKGDSNRLGIVEKRLNRLDEWLIEAISRIAESGFGSDVTMLKRWGKVELNHLRNGGPHYSDHLDETDEIQDENDDPSYSDAGSDPHSEKTKDELVIGNDSVRVWHEKNMEAMRREGVPWTINGQSI